MTTISIALTTFRAARFIGEQLDSFAAQTRLPDEVVVSDDGSTDGTAAIVERFAATAPFPVRYLRDQPRLGVHKNFERAVRATSGDLVFLSDDDDAWFPDKLATVEAVFAAEPAVQCVVNDQVIADADGRLSARTVLGNVRRLGYDDSYYQTGSCTALRRGFLPVLLPFPDGEVAYDHWINVIPDALGVRRVLETPLQMYRRHESNLTWSLLGQADTDAWTMATADTGDRRKAYRQQAEGLRLQRARLEDRRTELDALGLGTQAERAKAAFDRDRVNVERRLRTVSRPRFARPWLVARQLATGGYESFQGWRSAVKDLIAR